MNPERKTRLLIGSLATAVILVGGYALFQAMSPSQGPAAPATPPSAAPVPGAEPSSNTPLLRIVADTSVLANSNGNKATATAGTALYYEWSIQGGTIDGSNTGNSITWNAGNGTGAVLTCKGTNAAGQSGTSTFRVTLRRGPGISRFEAVPSVITEGSAAQLSWSADGVRKLVLDPGGQDVSNLSGPALQVKPAKTTTYTLTATNDAGDTETRELKLKVVPLPAITSLRAEPVAGSPTAATVIAEFRGGKAELKQGEQILASGETSPLRCQVTDLKDGMSLVFAVTNEAGTYVAHTLNISLPKK